MSDEPYRHLESKVEQGVLVLIVREKKVQGDEVAEALRKEMLAAAAQAGVNKVVVDFQHTEYISSAAFRPLLALRRKLQETGGRVILCGLSAAVGDVFYATRMISGGGSGIVAPLFDMEKDRAAAIAKLATTGPAT